MAKFDLSRDTLLNFTQVATALKLTVSQLDKLVKAGHFPAADLVMATKPVWAQRTVTTWLNAQPKAGSPSTVVTVS